MSLPKAMGGAYSVEGDNERDRRASWTAQVGPTEPAMTAGVAGRADGPPRLHGRSRRCSRVQAGRRGGGLVVTTRVILGVLVPCEY